jgi:hypothetical protein
LFKVKCFFSFVYFKLGGCSKINEVFFFLGSQKSRIKSGIQQCGAAFEDRETLVLNMMFGGKEKGVWGRCFPVARVLLADA